MMEFEGIMKSVLEQFRIEQNNRLFAWEKEANELVSSFVNDYPVDSIKNLSLDNYLLSKEGVGNSKTFCRTLRYDLQTVCSMGNAWPDCFGIYRSGSRIALSRTFSNMFGSDYEVAFKYIKNEICRLLEAAGKEDVQGIEKSKLNSLFKYKLISVYYHDKYVPVCAKTALEAYCNSVGLSYNKDHEMIHGIILLREWKESVPEISNWSNAMLMAFCDWMWRNKKKINGPSMRKKSYTEKAKEIDEEINDMPIVGESKEAVVKVRVNQGIFHDILLSRYGKCCLCGVSNKALLIASHIKPWRDSKPEEKLDVDNGLLLCPNHDRLFDKGFISFGEDGRILISNHLDQINRVYTNVNTNMRIDLTEQNKKYLEFHRKMIFQKD